MLQRLKPALKQQGITTSDSAREALAFLASLQQSSSGDNTGQLAETMCKVVELETKLADAEKAGAKHRAELEAQEQKLLEQSAAQQAMLLEEMTSAALLAWNERQKEQDAMMIAEREANNRVWQAEVRKRDQLLEVKEVEKARLQLEAAARVASLETSSMSPRLAHDAFLTPRQVFESPGISMDAYFEWMESGKVSLVEFLAAGGTAELFATFDVDKSGDVDVAELVSLKLADSSLRDCNGNGALVNVADSTPEIKFIKTKLLKHSKGWGGAGQQL